MTRSPGDPVGSPVRTGSPPTARHIGAASHTHTHSPRPPNTHSPARPCFAFAPMHHPAGPAPGSCSLCSPSGGCRVWGCAGVCNVCGRGRASPRGGRSRTPAATREKAHAQGTPRGGLGTGAATARFRSVRQRQSPLIAVTLGGRSALPPHVLHTLLDQGDQQNQGEGDDGRELVGGRQVSGHLGWGWGGGVAVRRATRVVGTVAVGGWPQKSVMVAPRT
jgi:hypothetical protein